MVGTLALHVIPTPFDVDLRTTVRRPQLFLSKLGHVVAFCVKSTSSKAVIMLSFCMPIAYVIMNPPPCLPSGTSSGATLPTPALRLRAPLPPEPDSRGPPSSGSQTPRRPNRKLREPAPTSIPLWGNPKSSTTLQLPTCTRNPSLSQVFFSTRLLSRHRVRQSTWYRLGFVDPGGMRSAVKGIVARRSASCRGLTSYGAARAQVWEATPASGAVDGRLGNLRPANLTRQPQAPLSPTYFDATEWLRTSAGSEQPQDPNKANLGKSVHPCCSEFMLLGKTANSTRSVALRILQERLPTLLQSPLPQAILAPNIALNLFPSTHPHLPTVSGRVAYNAALWTSPIAWNRVPIIGNVRLEILAERMTSEPLTFLPRRPGAIPEQLVVRWCEKRKTDTKRLDGSKTSGASGFGLGLGTGVESSNAFTGLFIFDFDKEGRILTHTIETAQQSGNWEKGVGAKFVGLTDWLLGGMKDPGETVPMFERLMKRRWSE